MGLFRVYLVVVCVMSLVTFAVYGWDKRRARGKGSRVAESTLHLLAMAGGWFGALVGSGVFRHKTRKRGFRAVLYGIVVLHVLLLMMAVRVGLMD